MYQRLRIVAVLLTIALATSCDDGPTSPGGAFVGTWAGAIVDSAAGTGTAKLVLTQSGSGISGSFTATFPNSSFDRTGTVSGTATANAASIFLTPAAPLSCGLSGTIGTTLSLSGTKATGNYALLACSGAVTGTLDLMRQ